eukprot:4906247-Amphidinium_carterae.1
MGSCRTHGMLSVRLCVCVQGQDECEPVEDAEKAVALSNAQVDRKAAKGLNACGDILCSAGSLALFNCVTDLTDPMERTFWSTVQALETSRGALEWHTNMCSLDRVWHDEVWDTLTSPSFALRLGLTTRGADIIPPLADSIADEVMLSAYMYSLRLIGADALWQENYHSTPPAVFSGLLSENAEDRASTGERIKRLWIATLALESRGHADATLQRLLDTIVWRRAPWVRELLISFEECNYERLPTDAEEEVRCAFMRGGTKIIEDLFGVLRRESTLTLNGRVDALHAYDCTAGSTRIREDDLTAVLPDPTDEVDTKVLVKELFDPTCNEFSLGDNDATWTELLDGKAYSHPSPESFMAQSMTTS